MSTGLVDALPFGLRDIKLTPYADAGGNVLGTVSYDLPNSQTMSFSETEDFTDLRGDDRLVATHGAGAQVDWSLEAGGVSLVIWSILSGGQRIVSGLSPNRVERMVKRGSDSRPYFRIDAQVISDSGGDLHCRIYRAKVNGDLGGDMGDGNFQLTSASGVGLPLNDEKNDLLYEFIRHEQKTNIPLTPEPNPIPTPGNLTVGNVTSTSVVLSWTAVPGADGYRVQRSSDAGATWTDLTPDPSDSTVTDAELSPNTAYQWQVAAMIDGEVSSSYSEPVGITTPAG